MVQEKLGNEHQEKPLENTKLQAHVPIGPIFDLSLDLTVQKSFLLFSLVLCCSPCAYISWPVKLFPSQKPFNLLKPFPLLSPSLSPNLLHIFHSHFQRITKPINFLYKSGKTHLSKPQTPHLPLEPKPPTPSVSIVSLSKKTLSTTIGKMREFWTTMASVMGVWALCQSLLHTVFPPELRSAFVKLFNRLFTWVSVYCYYDITEIDGVNTNELYNAVQLYLSSSASITGNRLSLTRGLNSSAITFGLSNNDRLVDVYNGVAVLWEHVVTQRQSQTFSWRSLPEEKRGFTLCIKKKDKSLILDSYLDFIMEKANEIRRKNQDRLLYTNSRGGSLDSRGHPWESVPFKHPSTFETLAMDPVKKTEIMADLRDFANGQSFYQETGRAWKRGYLLYGPPGTGKSSMIAAMANYLGYDIYDLELTEVHTNSELRKLLMKTSSKSIIVIEDIDCSINLTNRKKSSRNSGGRNQYDGLPPEMKNGSGEDGGNSITLSGLLNFTDGLWSCCGSERIFVFTTNHIEKLDPALLRSGRMDMHIFMSYCSFPALKILLKNYLGYKDGDLEDDVWEQFEEVVDKAEMTPADISEVLIKNRRDKDKAVSELLEALKVRAERIRVNGGLRERNSTDVEVEEQEKRALESPEEGCELPESCKKGDDQNDDEKM